MKRRNFIKLSLVACSSLFFSSRVLAEDINLNNVNFSKEIYSKNAAQTIVVYLYGGASQLAGNLTNIEEIKSKSQSDYDNYFRAITATKSGCWQEAGGLYMEDMLDSGDMTIFRCSYSNVREQNHNKAHGVCTLQNQKGNFDLNRGGIVTNIAQILEANGVVNENSVMPFVTLEGESNFYSQGSRPLSSYLRAVGLDENLKNPYSRYSRYWYYYTQEEKDSAPTSYNNSKTGFDPEFDKIMTAMAQQNNTNQKVKESFGKRESLSDFIDDIATATTPDLGINAYPSNDKFAQKLESSIKILANNEDTKVITINTGSLGGWDDHDDARNYVTRSEALFKSLKSAMAHLKALNKDGNISIMVYGEFGRNVNLNSALGWDHGNLQNFYVLGGKNYFTHKGVVGETDVEDTGSINRLYLKPKSGTYTFEHLSIAATLYKIFGVTNPEILTNNNPAVEI